MVGIGSSTSCSPGTTMLIAFLFAPQALMPSTDWWFECSSFQLILESLQRDALNNLKALATKPSKGNSTNLQALFIYIESISFIIGSSLGHSGNMAISLCPLQVESLAAMETIGRKENRMDSAKARHSLEDLFVIRGNNKMRTFLTVQLIVDNDILDMALDSGNLVRGGVVTEGSAGSTAISLATVAPAYGCKCHVVIPDDAAIEKSQILEALGATVERVRPVSITHRDHYVNIARRRAAEFTELASRQTDAESSLHVNGVSEKEDNPCYSAKDFKGGFFADQFENLANFNAHYEGTGPEIWEQTAGKLHAFIAAAGTGGTLAGVSRFLQEKNPNIKCFLIDPPGSGLFNKVTRGVLYTREEAEGQRLKNPFDTITEGIGINRLTKNFMMAKLDGAFRGTDIEAVEMSRFLLQNDGLFVGSSSAMNCVGAVQIARALGPGHWDKASEQVSRSPISFCSWLDTHSFGFGIPSNHLRCGQSSSIRMVVA
ncbi:hypothetical protein ACLOJK_000025 [Asimina triloba]